MFWMLFNFMTCIFIIFKMVYNFWDHGLLYIILPCWALKKTVIIKEDDMFTVNLYSTMEVIFKYYFHDITNDGLINTDYVDTVSVSSEQDKLLGIKQHDTNRLMIMGVFNDLDLLYSPLTVINKQAYIWYFYCILFLRSV